MDSVSFVDVVVDLSAFVLDTADDLAYPGVNATGLATIGFNVDASTLSLLVDGSWVSSDAELVVV